MTLNILNNINTISIYNVVNTTDKIKGKKRYLLKNVRRRKCRRNNVGAKPKYKNDEERKQAHNKQSLTHYHNKNSDYNKDIDKSISFIKLDKKAGEILTEFYAQHYDFNYFETLTLDREYKLKNKERAYTVDDYKDYVKQNYVSKQKDLTLNQFQNLVQSYLKNLKRDGKLIYDYYFISYEKNPSQNWHAHISFYIPLPYSDKNEYWHNWLNRSWKYGIAKALKIKSRNHLENKNKVLSYIGKDLNNLESEIIRWDCNIDKYSKRLPSQNDLTDSLDYALETFTHPETHKTLRQYGIR
ncbi:MULTISPECIES: hypothetical protein [Sphingobacterium]|uniref:hypothetical protein n=1 Tax=Sphingobacterium TaxID=28453 RepID=UPI0013DC9269|nr:MULTISPECIES: hypothetical protein [unclassified Sphingobacterium]